MVIIFQRAVKLYILKERNVYVRPISWVCRPTSYFAEVGLHPEGVANGQLDLPN